MSETPLTQIFIQSVNDKNIPYIRALIKGRILFDPTFSTQEYDRHMEYVQAHGIDITEPYEKRPDEFELPKEKWNEDYFLSLLEWFRLNFAPDKRIPKLKEVGRAVYRNNSHVSSDNIKTLSNKNTHTQSYTQTKQRSNPQTKNNSTFHGVPRRRRNEKNRQPSLPLIVAAAIAAVTLVAMIIWVIKK